MAAVPRRILLVDDDPFILKLYRNGLEKSGFAVETATDGLAALQVMRESRPDLVVLDLLMPRFSGVDVLKLVHSLPDVAAIPIIVLSNAYLDDLVANAAAGGAVKGLLKLRCNPSVLRDAINEVLEGRPSMEDTSELLAIRKAGEAPAPVAPPPPAEPLASLPAAPISQAPPAAEGLTDQAQDAETQARAQQELLNNGPAICASLRSLFQEYCQAEQPQDKGLRLQNLYRKVHFVAAAAGLAQSAAIAAVATAYEALLFEAMDKPARVTASVLRTMAAGVDLLEALFHGLQQAPEGVSVAGQVLVVDDDAISNRLVVYALRKAHLQAHSIQDPHQALEWLQANRCDLVLLDIRMPGMDGFELCQRLRAMTGYEKTPVIFVTSHGDLENRAKSVLSGGNELIAKPILPAELALKALIQLLKR